MGNLARWGAVSILTDPTALKEAARIKFPSDHIVGVWWSGSEEDVIPAGRAAKGYISAGFHPSGRDFPVIDDIFEYVQGRGKGNITELAGDMRSPFAPVEAGSANRA